MATDEMSKSSKASGITTTQATEQPSVVWSDSSIHTVYSNVADVAGTLEEIMLLFGETLTGSMGGKEFSAQLKERVVLSPLVPKRLAIMLNNSIRDHESKYGPLGEASTMSTAQEQMRSLIRNPPFSKTDKTAEKAGPLFQFIKKLDVEIGFERSFKMFHKTLLGKRFLLGIKKDTIRGGAHEKVLEMCTQLDMPDNFLEDFLGYLPEANVVGFGFDESERTSVCKVYLEFGGNFKEAIKKNPHRPAPFVLHRGFKWDLEDPSKWATGRYTCFSFLPIENLLERVSNILDPHLYGKSLDIAKDFVGTALSRVPAHDILYLELTEDNSPRRSFDINMYRANLQLKELSPILSRMCRHYSIPSEEFHSLYDPVKTEIFGHLAGGIDREGKDFLTIYYGVEGYYIP